MIERIKASEDRLPLISSACRSRFLLQETPTSKVVLFFHGFTATPQQFEPIGEAFFQAGYNVLIPLLPGHGIAGDWSRDRPPPLPETTQVYQEFGLHWLQFAQALGEKIIVGGLSGGSTLAAWLALSYPDQIDRGLLFAPYLRNSNPVVDLVVENLDIYFKWKTTPGVEHFGYEGFLMPALRVFPEMGQEIFSQAEQATAAPLLIVSSEHDAAVRQKDLHELFALILKRQPKAWYHCFDQALDVPHNMMTETEGNACVDLVIRIARAYVESDLTWAEVTAIRDRIRQGKTFDQAIAELNLSDRVSPDLQTLVTMI